MLCGSGEMIVPQKNKQVNSRTLVEETVILDSGIIFFKREKTRDMKGERQKEKWIISDTTEHSKWVLVHNPEEK